MLKPHHRPRSSLVGRVIAIVCALGLASAVVPTAANAATSPPISITSLTANTTSGTVDTTFVFTVTTNVPAFFVEMKTSDPGELGAYIDNAGNTNAPGSTVNSAKTVWTFKLMLKPGTRVLTFVTYETFTSASRSLAVTVKGMLLVGIGESFGSGEGNPPFNDGTTKCHRSAKAFTRLLDADTSLAVPLAIPGNGYIDGFQDCTGAVTANVLGSVNNPGVPQEKTKIGILQFGPEVQKLIGNYPTLVVMTMGGNDIGYDPYMECLVLSMGKNSDISCEPKILGLTPGQTGTELFDDNVSLTKGVPASQGSLRARLGNTYSAMLDAKPNIKILVVGYPQLVKNEPNVNVCGPVSGTRGRLFNLNVSLNSKVSLAVADSASKPGHAGRIFFVNPNAAGSPWVGHDLCSSNPYFNKLILFPSVAYSYHPNEDGHKAYESVIASWIAGHVADLNK